MHCHPAVLALFVCLAASPVPAAQKNDASSTLLNLDEIVEEGIRNNLGLLAERVNLDIAEANTITARLRPNPVFSFGADHLDWLGYGFAEDNGGGPTEIAWRVDYPIERGGKRRLRTETSALARSVAEAKLLDSIRNLTSETRVVRNESGYNKTVYIKGGIIVGWDT